jgi:hypothetical protein
LDVRGLPLITLMMIKNIRDELVRDLIKENYNPNEEETIALEIPCLNFINSNSGK